MKLKFFHISKTGGTTVERFGAKYGFKWGREDRQYLDTLELIKYIPYRWHAPIRYFKAPPYKCDTFTIIRNPYDRCISEYYCPYIGCGVVNGVKKMDINKWLKIQLAKDFEHFIPQYLYVFDSKFNKIITHVLKYENFPNNFNDLMLSKLKIDDRIGMKQQSEECKVNVTDFTEETIDLINKKYYHDFRLFGYNML